ncbi:MAG: hypothetical protein WDA71_04210 [Actinomycetota bacterium]
MRIQSLPEGWLRRAWLLVVVLAAVSLTLAGCGGSKDGVAAEASASGDQADALQAYRDCMRQHGVDLPSGFGGGGPGGFGTPGGVRPSSESRQPSAMLPSGVDQEEFQAAQEACEDKMPTGFGRAGDRTGGGAAYDAYLSCLRDHGVQVPSPSPSGQQQGPPMTFDRNDPAFQEADKTCSVLLPTPSGTPMNGQPTPGA